MNRTLLTASILAAGAAAGIGAYMAVRRGWIHLGSAGSQTNASDAMDDFEHDPYASEEDKVDDGVAQTFPASDPVAVGHASDTAYEREKRGEDAARERERIEERPARRSPDWLLQR